MARFCQPDHVPNSVNEFKAAQKDRFGEAVNLNLNALWCLPTRPCFFLLWDLSAKQTPGKAAMESGMTAPKPIFCVVLGDGEGWLVEAEWPDGTIEQIDAFKAYLDAINWISTQSKVWLQKRGG